MSSPGSMPNRPFFDDRNEIVPIAERFSAEYAVSFFLVIKDGKIEHVDSHLNFDDDFYIEALEKVGNARSGKITLDGTKWAFATQSMSLHGENGHSSFATEQYTHIAFLDITNSTEVIRVLFFTFLFVGIFVVLILLLISYRFSVHAIRPIEEGYNKQKQFVADASHELRTPLAIIGANVDAIETSGKESVESQKEWFNYIRAELKRTGRLVDDLLYLARAEEAVNANNLPTDLSLVCETACASMEAVLYDAKVSLDTVIDRNIRIVGDEEKIKQVLYILLDNAGKYTPAGGHIEVSLRCEQDKAVVRVTNTGNEIDIQELSKIFDRFYRSDASRSQETGGFGLGLSIAKTIVERSGGEIFVQSFDGHTTFTIHFKLS